MTYTIARSDADIDNVLNLAHEQTDKGGTAYSGMTYEDGVAAGIEWATGLGDNEPPLP